MFSRRSIEKAEISSCPYCESEVEVNSSTQHDHFWVKCPTCGMEGPHQVSDKLAILAWNNVCYKTTNFGTGSWRYTEWRTKGEND